jgi:hypothetical protein
MICDLPPQQDPSVNEIIELAQSIQAVQDNHSFVDLIIHTLNVNRPVGMHSIVKVAALSPDWAEYVDELRNWLEERRPLFIEDFEAPVANPV